MPLKSSLMKYFLIAVISAYFASSSVFADIQQRKVLIRNVDIRGTIKNRGGRIKLEFRWSGETPEYKFRGRTLVRVREAEDLYGKRLMNTNYRLFECSGNCHSSDVVRGSIGGILSVLKPRSYSAGFGKATFRRRLPRNLRGSKPVRGKARVLVRGVPYATPS